MRTAVAAGVLLVATSAHAADPPSHYKLRLDVDIAVLAAGIALWGGSAAVGNSAAAADSVPPGFTTLGRSANAAGQVTFTGHGATSGQFVLIWFTKLAPQADQSGHYQADVFNVVVRGSS